MRYTLWISILIGVESELHGPVVGCSVDAIMIPLPLVVINGIALPCSMDTHLASAKPYGKL